MVFINCPFIKEIKYIDIKTETIRVRTLKHILCQKFGLPDQYCLLYSSNSKLSSEDAVKNDSSLHVLLTLPGGKGGFGSMLRAIGAQIEKTTNREACRDLSGRRLRDINEEQRLKKWIAKKAEREAEAARRRKERLERLKSAPKHEFHDSDYNKLRSELPERVNEAVIEALQKAPTAIQKNDDEFDEDDDEDEEEDGEPLPKKACFLSDYDLPGCSAESNRKEDSNSVLFVENTTIRDRTNILRNVEQINENVVDTISSNTSQEAISDESLNKQDILGCSAERNKKEDNNNFSSSEVNIVRDGTNILSDVKPKNENNIDITINSTVQESTNDILCNKQDIHFQNNCNDYVFPIVSTSSECIVLSAEQNDCLSEKPLPKRIQDENCSEYEILATTIAHPSESSEEKNEENLTIDLMSYNSPSELEILGLERLKLILKSMGLKCGGSISERAQRLWKVRGLSPEDYPKSLLAKK